MALSVCVTRLKHLSKVSKLAVACALAPSLASGSCRRYLFSSEVLGLEKYERIKHDFTERINPVRDKICSNIETYLQSSEENTVFTEDLKVMVYVAESERELDLVVKMIRRFNEQNSVLRFSNFTFGPLVMRLLHLNSKPDLAYELYMDKSLSHFFEQISSVRTLMDLLYENKRYEQVLATMDVIKEQQIDGIRFPMDCLTLAAASCYQMNTAESLEKLISLLKEVGPNAAIVSHRSLCYGAVLAINQKRPEVAQEVLSLVNEEVTKLPVLYINVKLLTYAALGRVEQAINLLRSMLSNEVPDHARFRGIFYEDVLAAVREATLTQTTNKELLNTLARVEKVLKSDGHVTAGVKLADSIDCTIMRSRKLQDGFKNRTRPSAGDLLRTGQQRHSSSKQRNPNRRPGLMD